MQIAEVVALPPACCAICKKGNAVEKPFVDTLSHYPQGQRMDRIYVCAECVEEMAGLYGMVSQDQAQKYQDQIDAQADEINVLSEQNDAFDSIKKQLGIVKPAPASKSKASAQTKENKVADSNKAAKNDKNDPGPLTLDEVNSGNQNDVQRPELSPGVDEDVQNQADHEEANK